MNHQNRSCDPGGTAKDRKTCEQTFLGSVAGLQREEGAPPPGPARRALGLALLAGVHLHMIAWSAAISPFVPRYRRVLRFQARYFLDVMKNELRPPL